MSFWTDTKVADDFTPEDRFFYLYLFTNPHTNLAGCYEISIRQMANETGYSNETIERLISRFTTIHKVIEYAAETKEMLLFNWHKYNWTKSEDFRKALGREIYNIKNPEFKGYLRDLYDGVETVHRPSKDGVGTTVTVTDTVTVSNTDINTNTKKEHIDKTPYKEILEMYHSICPAFPKVRAYTDKRKKGVKARLKTYSLEDLKEAFSKAAASKFMNGENDRNWKPDFEWFFISGDNNIAKVLEGKYDNRNDKGKNDLDTGYDPAIWERLANERREDFD